MSLWVVQEDEFFLLGAVDSLEFEGEERFLKCLLVSVWDEEFAFATDSPEETFYVHSSLVDKPVRLLKPDAFDRFEVVTAG